ncbi:molecular chaperone [Coemansia spiralis]|uniref:Molecular chaperone n=2 Tax=Coemansia TaxID=4863 RepID=A0A9W8KZA7_9FUNG|nr:hypothetical protein BX070DRAFT_257015 [Coemansia spiralis]KAJ1996002.1 molecular chaperone [Coemansia umbellata]KAJ2625445.1 molecular chaperone [Coemansia sp. RSA 1358]KAJ2680568.1 molecular chaperone [Coemansia spiralis]
MRINLVAIPRPAGPAPVGKDTTYFDVLLDGQPSFDIDTSTLRRNFLKIQQLVHPDNFTQAPKDINRKHARVQSAWVNHAYTTLKDQLLRAHYLLELYNEGIGEDDQITDPEFLMEIMELRDEIEMAETDQQTAEIKVQNDAKIAEIVKRLSAAFGSKDYALAKQLTHHLQYLHRATQAIHDWEPGKPVTIPH